MEGKKETYKSPEVKAYGSLAELTKGANSPFSDGAGGGSEIG